MLAYIIYYRWGGGPGSQPGAIYSNVQYVGSKGILFNFTVTAGGD